MLAAKLLYTAMLVWMQSYLGKKENPLSNKILEKRIMESRLRKKITGNSLNKFFDLLTI
jgi:hypothetical protein